MAKGPFGFPRVTNIGPFVNVEAEQRFVRDEENTFIVGTDVDREVATLHSIDIDDVYDVTARLTVDVNEEVAIDGILERLITEVENAVRGPNVAVMDYWYDPDAGVAKIFDITVEEDFRRMGIATQLKEQEMEYMNNQGVELVYTDIISEGGYRLAKATGFRPVHEADHLHGKETILEFNDKRGIMFKHL